MQRCYSLIPIRFESSDHTKQSTEFWANKENIYQFLSKLQLNHNLKSPEDWNSVTRQQILAHGGRSLLKKHSMFELKCMACPEGKSIFYPKKPSGYWENKENILNFLTKLKEKYNLNSPNDWNSILTSHIQSNGGSTLLSKYSIYALKCMACPEGKFLFNNPQHPSGYWENKENILQFLSKIKEKYNLKTPDDWNSITTSHIQSNGGSTLLKNCSIFELKCMACPEGKSSFKNTNQTTGYWDNKENVDEFLSQIKEKYKLNTPEEWDSITQQKLFKEGAGMLLRKYSMFELKCLACPEGKSLFKKTKQTTGYWENKENVHNFLSKIQEEHNIKTPEDWNKLTATIIHLNGGGTLLNKYSLYELKCLACPEGKSSFNNPPHISGYWDNKENVLQFLSKIQEKYNLKTPEDWNSITYNKIKSDGGKTLLSKYSMFEIKCIACPEGKSIFLPTKQPKPSIFWEDETNRKNFFDKLQKKFNLQTPEDWRRISKNQILSQGGSWLFKDKYQHIKIQFECSNNETIFLSLKELLSNLIPNKKRSAQRWLFLQVQKLFPGEEMVEDYYHSDLSRKTGSAVQFDIFMIHRNIAIEYHGKQHYEDIPQVFSNVETYKNRDIEKEKICSEHGIQLIVIPYWWDNKLDSLRTFMYSKINL